jgi:LPS sulfotransferase NodH
VKPPVPTLSYLVCGTERSGSTLLCGLLKGTGVAGRPEEYFWRGQEPCWAERWGVSGPAAYLEAAIKAATTANGVAGAKVMWGHLPDLYAKLRAVHGDRGAGEHELLERAFPKLHFVWIRREDLVAQAVSFSRALQTQRWTADDRRPPAREPRFDFAQIDTLLGELRGHNEAASRWFAANRIHPFCVRYEDLVQDMRGVTRDLLAFLGVELPGDTLIRPQHSKQADLLNEEWADRYRAMARAAREAASAGERSGDPG